MLMFVVIGWWSVSVTSEYNKQGEICLEFYPKEYVTTI